jgi:dihydroorotate dehydrogenase (fumarate)
MDIRTHYMGLHLANPLVASASPLSMQIDTARRLEDAGAGAIVMYSLFEEQIEFDVHKLDHYLTTYNESYAEALSYFPEPDQYQNLYAEEYLDHIRNLKECLSIPVIASLNGVSAGNWLDFAKLIEQAGADALELNIYYMATDPAITGSMIENMVIEDVKAVKRRVKIPVAVKLGPYFSSFANLAVQIDHAGADGLVLFNRFYQPDLDLEKMEVEPSLVLSTPAEKRLPMRWIAILHGQVKASLAATSGIHVAEDVAKLILCGADITMVASVLLKNGVGYLAQMLKELNRWMEDREYPSIEEMKGSMSYRNVAEPAAYERANYLKVLQKGVQWYPGRP